MNRGALRALADNRRLLGKLLVVVAAIVEALEELGMVVCEDGAYRLQG